MRIGLCQLDSQWEDKGASKDRISKLAGTWAGRADCLVFPEMTLTGFSMRPENAALSKADHDFFALLAAEQNCSLVYGGVEDVHNRVFQVEHYIPAKLVYQRRHLFRYGGECDAYKAGD